MLKNKFSKRRFIQLSKNIPRSRLPETLLLILYFSVLIVLMTLNNQILFEETYLNRFGDQRLYIELAHNILSGNFSPHPYSVGYSLFLAPILLFSQTGGWQAVATIAVAVQAFVLMPLNLIILTSLIRKVITKLKTSFKISFVFFLSFFILYEFFVLLTSKDLLPKYLSLGLIPYSETLSLLLITVIYYIFVQILFFQKEYRLFMFFFLGLMVSYTVTVRIVVLILLLPVLILPAFLFFERKNKKAFMLISGLFLGYLPQFIYNNFAYNNPFSIGYNWYWEKIRIKYQDTIKNIYNTGIVSQFSLVYLKTNINSLFWHYLNYMAAPLFFLFLFFKRVSLSKQIFFLILINISITLYVMVYLSYWWSNYVDCIDRFLMPAIPVVIVSLLLTIKFLNEKKNSTN